MADVDVGSWLNLLAGDYRTWAIVTYLESITNPRKFMSAAACIKPVVVIRSGRHEEVAKGRRPQTDALSGADRVVDAGLRCAGILRVQNHGELFDTAEFAAPFTPLKRACISIVTNGGGAGVLAVDQLI